MFSINRFQEVLQAVPRATFDRSVKEHRAERYVKKFFCWDQLVAMVYLQLAGARGLRELQEGVNAHPRHHYHLNIKPVARSTLADANSARTPLVFAELLEALIAQAGRTVRKQRQELLYLLDATTVPVPSRCKDWRGHENAHGNHGIKLHVLFDANSLALETVSITPARINDITEGKKLDLQAGATYVFDKGYCNYSWWHRIAQTPARWVTRFKRDAALRLIAQRPLREDAPHIVSDSIVVFALRTPRGRHKNPYSTPLRRIEVARPDAPPLVLATNDLASPAAEIAQLYKHRWQIELLFKWVKQHLQIGHFVGHNENAMRIQLLTALIAYMLVLLLKHATGFKQSLWTLLQQLRHSLFQRPKTEESYWRRRQRQMAHIDAVQPSLL